MMKRMIAASFLLLAVAGCRFDRHKGQNGESNDVKFATPFGGMSVKTDEKTTLNGVGLSVYPGAVLRKKENGSNDDGAADVNFSFGNVHLGVKALTYQSSDQPDKVLAFYRKDMAHFGTIIQCHHHAPVGQPTRTQDGLACDSESKTKVHVDDDGDQGDELKAGSKLHQHIVAVEARNGGTKIGLVALDLPGNLGGGDDSSKE